MIELEAREKTCGTIERINYLRRKERIAHRSKVPRRSFIFCWCEPTFVIGLLESDLERNTQELPEEDHSAWEFMPSLDFMSQKLRHEVLLTFISWIPHGLKSPKCLWVAVLKANSLVAMFLYRLGSRIPEFEYEPSAILVLVVGLDHPPTINILSHKLPLLSCCVLLLYYHNMIICIASGWNDSMHCK